jgi:hypothetical protein
MRGRSRVVYSNALFVQNRCVGLVLVVRGEVVEAMLGRLGRRFEQNRKNDDADDNTSSTVLYLASPVSAQRRLSPKRQIIVTPGDSACMYVSVQTQPKAVWKFMIYS